MQVPELPPDEAQRLQALQALQILDTQAEQRFDRLTHITQRAFKTPIVLISLVDAERQWFKSKQGLEACETPRSVSFCGHAILGREVFVVEDALADHRFADNPLVTGAPFVRFYAGAPLLDQQGHALGTLCLIDHVPRHFSAEQLALLTELAEAVSAELQMGDRERQLQQLARQQSDWKALVQTMVDGVLEIDQVGTVLYSNPATERLLGYTAAELLGRNVKMLMPETVAQAHDGYLQRYREGGERHIIGIGREVQGQHKDGHLLPLHLSVSEMTMQGERRYLGVLRDLSAKEKAQRDVAALVERLDLATAAAGLAIWEWNIESGELIWDDRCFRLYGRRREDFSHAYAAWLDSLHQDDKPAVEAAIEEALAGRKPYDCEFRIRWPDGSIRYMKADGVILRDDNGKPIRMLGTNYDISARKQAELQLQAITIMQGAIFDCANVSIISTDTDGVIRSFNHCAERWLGYSADELIGKHNPGLFHDGSEVVARAAELSRELGETIEPGFDSFVAKPRRGLGADEREWTYVARDGRRFMVQLSVTALHDAAGQLQGFLGIAIDVSERKLAEQAKNEFISTVSHELRTPLTSIRGALGLIKGKYAANLPDKAQAMLDTALRNSDRLTALINDLLDLEKMAAGQLSYRFTELDLGVLLHQAVSANEGFASLHGISLQLAEILPVAPFIGDEQRLVQVLANLVSNAVKFSPAGASVELNLSVLDECYRISVQDHGCGIPVEFQPRLFQRFAQADSSDRRAKGGTGLGLAICKSIVEAHSGRIGFQTGDNGTCFEIELPLPNAAATTGSDVSVLLCEDNADVALVMQQMLLQLGYRSRHAASLQAARQALGQHKFRLLLLDYGLPDGNGLDFLHELRGDSRYRQLPVVIVSAREADQLLPQTRAVELIDWLQKPVDPERLQQALQLACARLARPRILHVEDDRDLIQVVQAQLAEQADYQFATSLAQARDLLAQNQYDLMLLDLGLPDGNGLELLPDVHGRLPVLLFSGQEPTPAILQQLAGALQKSQTSMDELGLAVARLLPGNTGGKG